MRVSVCVGVEGGGKCCGKRGNGGVRVGVGEGGAGNTKRKKEVAVEVEKT